MRLAEIWKTQANRVMGIDASTKSIAFSIFEDGRPAVWGKLLLEGNNIYEKCGDAQVKMAALVAYYKPNYIAIESAVMVRKITTALMLAYVYGAIMGAGDNSGAQMKDVPPMVWQSFIGNKTFTTLQKKELMAEFPGKTKSWYTAEIRRRRKQITMDFCLKKFGIEIHDDDVGDAIAIGYYTEQELTKRN